MGIPVFQLILPPYPPWGPILTYTTHNNKIKNFV